MSAGTFQLYDEGKEDLLNEDFAADDHYCVLLGAGYSFDATDVTLNDIVAYELAGGGDYAPQDMTGESVVQTAGTVKVDADDVAYGDPVDIEAKWAVVVRGNVAGKSTSDRLVGAMDLNTDSGSATAVASAGEFTVHWHVNGLATIADA